MTPLKPLEPANIASLVGIEYLGSEEQVAVLSEIGRVTLEGCLLKFISRYTDAEQEELDIWLSEHRTDETLTEALLQRFPKFAAILSDELEALASSAAKAREALKAELGQRAPAYAQ